MEPFIVDYATHTLGSAAILFLRDLGERDSVCCVFVLQQYWLCFDSKIYRLTMVHQYMITYARNTPGSICQYKEDGLVSRPPSLFTSVRLPMHGTSCPKSQLKSTCLTAKFGSFLDHAETGEKGQNVISSSVQHPISLFLQSMFLLSYFYQWCGYCWQGLCRNLWPQFVYIALSLDWKINI